jgi:hypothetical protein
MGCHASDDDDDDDDDIVCVALCAVLVFSLLY